MRALVVSVLVVAFVGLTDALGGAHDERPSAHPIEVSHADSAKRRRRRIPAEVRCTVANECIVVPVSCCGSCGAATPGDARAVNAEARRARAGAGEPTCEGSSSCPDCYQRTAPTLVATCRAGECALVDLTRDRLTECRVDSECETTFAGCCACGSEGPIALARGRRDDYRRLICGAGPVACPECVGRPVPAGAACVAGHCVAPGVADEE